MQDIIVVEKTYVLALSQLQAVVCVAGDAFIFLKLLVFDTAKALFGT